MSDDEKVTEIFVDYFSNIAHTIEIPSYEPQDNEYLNMNESGEELNIKHFFPWEVKKKINLLMTR